MKKKTKVALTAAIALAVAGGAVVRAQNKANNPYRAAVRARFEAMATKLNLSAAQKQEIAPLVKGGFAQGRAVVLDSTLTAAQKRERLQTLRAATLAKIAARLTPAQRRTAQDLYAGRRQRVQGALKEIADELQMTDKQRSEAMPVIEDAFKQARAIWLGDSDFTQKRAKLVRLHGATREKMASILSPEQLRKLALMQGAVRAEVVSRVAEWGA